MGSTSWQLPAKATNTGLPGGWGTLSRASSADAMCVCKCSTQELTSKMVYLKKAFRVSTARQSLSCPTHCNKNIQCAFKQFSSSTPFIAVFGSITHNLKQLSLKRFHFSYSQNPHKDRNASRELWSLGPNFRHHGTHACVPILHLKTPPAC